MAEQYWIRIRGRTQGPFTAEDLQARAKRGGFSRLHEVSLDQIDWQRASKYPELFPSAPQTRSRQQSEELPDMAPLGGAYSPERREETAIDAIVVPDDGYSLASKPAVRLTEANALAGEQLWYYAHDGREQGPVPFSQLQVLAGIGQLEANTLLWREGMPDWISASQVPGVFVNSGVAVDPQASASSAGPSTSILAIISFVLGLLGTSLLFFVGSVAAIVLGYMALREIRQSRGTLVGRDLATAGLVLGYLVIIAAVLIGIVILVNFQVPVAPPASSY